MDLSHALEGLSETQLMKYGPKTSSWKDTKAALKSGTRTTSKTTGLTPRERRIARAISSGSMSDINELIEEHLYTLQTADPAAKGSFMEAYRNAPPEDGGMVVATDAYRRSMRRLYPGYGTPGVSYSDGAGGAAEGMGGIPIDL